ncbi:MAG: glycosyltransferase family 39 protein [Acidobacteria bacterium]|nr:glycosyltransferase family 39 protein [Acidobacteriota bacterium]
MSRHAVILAGVCVLTFFVGLGRPALTDSDEAFYAESAREMIERGDWLTPYYNGQPRFEKPVLYYWLVAVTYVAAGPSPGAARFPAALAGVGLVLVTFACARRWYDGSTALLAGLIGATSAGIVAMARQALPDLPLAFFVTLAVWAALVALLEDPHRSPGPRQRRAWLLLAALAAGAAFLVKGPVGPALAALVVLPLAALDWRRHGLPSRATRVDLALAAALFLLVAAPWYAAMAIEHGAGYLERFFLAENLERYASDRYNAPRPPWYYLPIIAGGLLPWSPFMLLWAAAARESWRRRILDQRVLRLAVWAAAPLAFYTLSVGKQPRYILPLLAPLAILLARAVTRALEGTPARRRALATLGAATGAVVMVIGGLVYRARPLLVEWNEPVTLIVALAVFLAGGAVAAFSVGAWRHGPDATARAGVIPTLVAAAAVVMAVGAHLVVLASPGPSPVERMAAMLAVERNAGEPYGRHRVFDRNLVYYMRTAHVELPVLPAAYDFLSSPGRVLCVLRAEDAVRLRQDGLRLQRLAEVRYLNTGSLNLRTLLNPDPQRYLQRVVLVANR